MIVPILIGVFLVVTIFALIFARSLLDIVDIFLYVLGIFFLFWVLTYMVGAILDVIIMLMV